MRARHCAPESCYTGRRVGAQVPQRVAAPVRHDVKAGANGQADGHDEHVAPREAIQGEDLPSGEVKRERLPSVLPYT